MSSAAAEIDFIVKEVFINPIRTVIVVDDEYPTLDSLTAKEMGSPEGWSGDKKEIQQVRALLDFARKRVKPWLIDVHDGKKITSKDEGGIATHLDHSDLLVLDYHLDGNEADGEAAINILRKLAHSEHFNLVIVYTKGYAGDITKVSQEIALSLTSPDPALSFTDDERESLKATLEEWEIQDEGITAKLEAELSTDTYLKMRTLCPDNLASFLGCAEGQRIFDLWKARPKNIKIKPQQLLKWLSNNKQEQLAKQFSSEGFGNVQIGNTNNINWIKTNKLFITVISKMCSPDQFEGKLTDAIKASTPSPHRLLLTKMRADIDNHGLKAEAAILEKRQLQAVWLNDFLQADPVDLKTVINNTVSRHWEALGDELSWRLCDFAERLHAYFIALEKDEIIKKCGLNPADVEADESLKLFNWFSSTKPIDRSHLTTGHVLRIDPITEDDEANLWICLSPACDMVPGQKNYSELGDCIPFVAVQLHEVSDYTALKNATENIYLFLENEKAIKAYSIYKDGNIKNNPKWEQKFAFNKGRFRQKNTLGIGTIFDETVTLGVKWRDAEVVAQLRSEYALNLLQRIGALLSRPGLGINFKARQQK